MFTKCPVFLVDIFVFQFIPLLSLFLCVLCRSSLYNGYIRLLAHSHSAIDFCKWFNNEVFISEVISISKVQKYRNYVERRMVCIYYCFLLWILTEYCRTRELCYLTFTSNLLMKFVFCLNVAEVDKCFRLKTEEIDMWSNKV